MWLREYLKALFSYHTGDEEDIAGAGETATRACDVDEQSRADKKLQSDVRFWFSPIHGNANACLTVRIQQSNIRVEQWHRDHRGRICRKGVVWITKTTDRLVVDNNYPIRISVED
ncbi:hypothetical protein N7478_010879 [Penicillium angulare]|uniref:uncharacterized protein n=1 Tax=Penicillium angulare TaxID=116970 RepID=UPI002541E641|nr:uncharacterized protein N7478_010879 [Penicillium angulare]KAJ5263274.1 hypothetical protein N7478_010879 [Penicillium angulare]